MFLQAVKKGEPKGQALSRHPQEHGEDNVLCLASGTLQGHSYCAATAKMDQGGDVALG